MDIELLQSPSLTYQVTSLPGSFVFGDLGTGTFYGSRTYTSADALGPALAISLDADALNAIMAAAGGAFGVGGRVTSATLFGNTELNQVAFSHSGGAQRLVLVTTVPEPASLLLLGTGLIGAVRAVRRRRG